MSAAPINIAPWCPFCSQTIDRPDYPAQRKLGEFAVGRCQCGAVYACDATGHNVGAAMIEALVYSCNDDWDLAWSLTPEDDYLTGRLEKYDEQTHQIVEEGQLDGRWIRGVLYFIRLHEEAARQTAAIARTTSPQPATNRRLPALEPLPDPKRKKTRADKNRVRQLVENQDIDGLVHQLFDDKRTLRFLQRLLYSPEEPLRWQTVNAIGKACGRYATRYPGAVSDLLHRLFEAASDSAASSWGAIEAIGAIIANRPDIYGAFTRHLLRHMNDRQRQPLVLWALGSIAASQPSLVRELPFYSLFNFLNHPDPLTRGMLLRLLGHIQAQEVRKRIEPLCQDLQFVTYYDDGVAITTTIGQLAATALAAMDTKEKSSDD